MTLVRPDQLNAPTPCSEFDVRTLLGHLVGTAERGLATGNGRSTRPIPHVITDIADGAHAARYMTTTTAAHGAWGLRQSDRGPGLRTVGRGHRT